MAHFPKRIAIVGGGISGLGVAWTLQQHPERYEVTLFEEQHRLGGNACTVDIPQNDGSSVPIDISVTALIPSAYHNYVQLLKRLEIALVPTRLSYVVRYGDGLYAHDTDSNLRAELQDDIDRFQRALKEVQRFSFLSKVRSRFINALNPFNYVTMRFVLDTAGVSQAARVKVIKPLFVNFLLASNVFDLPASLFARYLEFFDVEMSTPMMTWDQGTRNIYQRMTSSFKEKIHLGKAVRRVRRSDERVVLVDEKGIEESFDEVVLACPANRAFLLLEDATFLERRILSSVRYESELHNHAYVHTDASVVTGGTSDVLETRSNYIEHYGTRPDNYELTYVMHNQQPWAKRSDRPCLVTYNPIHAIDPSKMVYRTWFQHLMTTVGHAMVLLNGFKLIQGKRHTWYCGAHTLVNSQEHAFVSGMTVARQLGADYPFDDPEARRWFNYWGRLMFGLRFRKSR